jgi:hypothetical protein
LTLPACNPKLDKLRQAIWDAMFQNVKKSRRGAVSLVQPVGLAPVKAFSSIPNTLFMFVILGPVLIVRASTI